MTSLVNFAPDQLETTRQRNARRIAMLVSSLIQMVQENADVGRLIEASPGDQQILLDVEMDGVRCVLVRQSLTLERVSFSPREIEVARMVAKGYPNKTIAMVLDISANTVNTYLRRIFAKLGVNTRAAMVARLMEITVVTDGIDPAIMTGEPHSGSKLLALEPSPSQPNRRDNHVVMIEEW